jgi:hypothetical protein
MRDLPRVQVVQSFSQSADDGSGAAFGGAVVGLGLEVVVERDAVQELHDDVEVVVGLHHVEDLHDVGVVQSLQYLNLPPH